MQDAKCKIKIGDRTIGEGEPIFVIAEAGINHDGKINQAERLIVEAARAGADAVKFQSFKASRLVNRNEPFFKLFKDLELSRKDHQHLMNVAESEGIIFLSTPFDEESGTMLAELGVAAFKVASGDLTHLPLLEHLAGYKRPIILSTGMATLFEIEEAIGVMKQAGNEKIVLLHCNSTYPAKICELNLKTIITLREAFGFPVGFSDHTIGNLAPLVAAVIGAVLIEKHFTLDRSLPGPDHRLSLEPEEMKEMTTTLRLVRESLGDGIKRPSRREARMRILARRSIVARYDLARGTTITRRMLDFLRPGGGLPPGRIKSLLGRTIKRHIREGEMIRLEDVK